MSKYRLFNMSILKAKAQEGQTEGNLYVAATLEIRIVSLKRIHPL